mmetsp:Transcript_4322/g.7354  ORF Transcript_4322/g.7354 Transcript_4322/m.7354 type:complete len:574 (+) Transcript_4322:68-1789(+)
MAVDAMRQGRDEQVGRTLDPDLRWKSSTEVPRSRLPDIVFQNHREAPGAANRGRSNDMEDPIFRTHSKLYMRRKEIEEELRREFNLPAEEVGGAPPGARARNGPVSFGHPPPVPHLRPAARNLPPVPKLGQQQNWPRWGVVDDAVNAAGAGSAAPVGKESPEPQWWQQEQQELERRKHLRSTTPDVVRGREPVRENIAEPPVRAGRTPSPGAAPCPGPPLPQEVPRGMQARERPYSWRSPHPQTPRTQEEMSTAGAEPSSGSSAHHRSKAERRASQPRSEAAAAEQQEEGSAQKPHQRKARELQEQAKALKRERQAQKAQEVDEQPSPPPPPHPPPAPFQPHAPPPNHSFNAASRRAEEDARRRILEEKARELEEQERDRRRERMMQKVAEQEEARARQRRAAEELAEELKRREEQKFEEMRREEMRRIQRQQEEARQRRKEQEDWEAKFRKKLEEEQRELRGRSEAFRASFKRRQNSGGGGGLGASQRTSSVPAMPSPHKRETVEKQETMRHAEARAMQQLSAVQRLPNKDAKHKAYKELLRAWHPDKNPSNAAIATAVFQRIQAERVRLGL